jgi:hypothetical protein
MEEVNKELYWATSKAFDKMSNTEQIRFLNNMIDIKTKRLDAKRENGFLIEYFEPLKVKDND